MLQTHLPYGLINELVGQFNAAMQVWPSCDFLYPGLQLHFCWASGFELRGH